HLILDRSQSDSRYVERASQCDDGKKQCGSHFPDSPTFPQLRQQQSDERGRCEPPIVEDLDVVPDPWRHLQDVRNDEAERKWQVEKQQTSGNEVTFGFVENGREDQRDKESRIFQPEIDRVLLAVVPSQLPREKASCIYGAVHCGPEQLRNRDRRGDGKESKPFAPAELDQRKASGHRHHDNETMSVREWQQSCRDSGS